MKKLWKHQEEARKRAQRLPYFGLFMEMGTGKSGACISMLRDKYNHHGKILPTLIICPPIVIQNWAKEFAMFSKIPIHEIVPLVGKGKDRLKLFKESRAHIFITNYETLLMRDMYNAFYKWLGLAGSVLVLDESHKVKEKASKRTMLAIKLSDQADYRYILTGTPILNSYMDIWSQFRVLDGGRRFGKNFFSFRSRFFYDKNANMPKDRHFPDWQPRPRTAQKLSEKIKEISMHVKKLDCLDLPPLVRKVIEVDMGGHQRRYYNQMKKDFITIIDDKACVAEFAMTKALRLQQIVSGFAAVEAGSGQRQTIKLKDNPRLATLKELLEDLTPSHKVIVWAVFKNNYGDIRDVCEELDVDYVEVHGDISQKDQLANVERFNTDDSCRVFIGNPGSGGVGINLVSSDVAIVYSRNFSLEQYLQAEARNHRGGSEIHQKITKIELVTPETIDELVLKALANKEELGYQVLKDNIRDI